ncbi:hypothetical protein JCM3766R1_003465 [Sporobolomyces carnicolor]
MVGGVASFGSAGGEARTRWTGQGRMLSPLWMTTWSFFGLQLVWSCEMAQASPFLLSLGVSKSMMAVVFVAGPLSGLLAQPLVGVLSDSCKSKFGRRRPFIFGGVVVSSISVMLLGWAKEVASLFANEGGTAHRNLAIAFAVAAVYLIDFSVNVVQAMDRALLVDVVPPAEQASANAWAARMFGFGAVFGYGLGTLDLVRWTGGIFGDEQIKVIALFTTLLVCATHTVTLTCVQERILISQDDDGRRGHPIVRVCGEVWHTLRTIPRPIQSVFNVQLGSWIGWFPILFFTTTWIAEIYVTTLRPTSYSELADAPLSIQEDATRAGTTAMFYHSVVSLVTSIVVPPLIAPTHVRTPSRTPNHVYGTTPPAIEYGFFGRLKRFFPIPISWLSLPLLWTFSTALFGALLLTCSMVRSVSGATTVIALIGFNWACTNWIPFAVLAELILRIDSKSLPKPIGSHSRRASAAHSIMLHSSRPSRSHKANASTSTANLHTLGSASDEETSDISENESAGRPTIDLNRTPRPTAAFAPAPAPASPMNLSRSRGSSSNGSYQDLPPTPATGTSEFSTASTAYFDLPSPSPTHSLSTPPLPAPLPDNHHAFPASNATLSPAASPDRPTKRARDQKRDRTSITSSATIEYPPNNGGEFATFDPLDEYGRVVPASPASVASPRALRADHLNRSLGDTAGASTSTIKLPLSEHGRTKGHSWARDDNDEIDGFGAGDQSFRTIRVRHSDDLSSMSARSDERSFGGSASEGEEDHVGERARRMSKLRRDLEADSEDDVQDDWLRQEHDIGITANGGGRGGGDQAGVILGCHNIYLVLPQFVVTALSSIIFAIFDPGKSILGSHAPPVESSSADVVAPQSPSIASALASRDMCTEWFEKYALTCLERDRIGGISALVATYYCFRLWRDSVEDERRALRTRVGYGRIQS